MDNIENVNKASPEKPKNAEWWRRLIGSLIDSLPILFLSIVIAEESGEPVLLQFYFVIFYIPYCIIFEGIFNRTLGKIVTGTIVVSSIDIEKPSFWQVLGRSFSRLIPFDVFSFISANPSGWHDSIPNTMVTTKKSIRMFKTGSAEIDYNSANFMQKRIVKLKSINKGVYRLIITISFFLPFILGIYFESNERHSSGEVFFGAFIYATLIYWIIIFIGLWIYEGFEEG